MTKRKIWWNLLDESIQRHLRVDAGVRSASGMRRTMAYQNDKDIVCRECRHAAFVLRSLRPDLQIPEPKSRIKFNRHHYWIDGVSCDELGQFVPMHHDSAGLLNERG